MRLHYYPDTDSLYIEFRERSGAESREVTEGVIVDLDVAGRPVGFDIDCGLNDIDLSSLDATGLPLRSFTIR